MAHAETPSAPACGSESVTYVTPFAPRPPGCAGCAGCVGARGGHLRRSTFSVGFFVALSRTRLPHSGRTRRRTDRIWNFAHGRGTGPALGGLAEIDHDGASPKKDGRFFQTTDH